MATTVTISGTLADFGLESLASFYPRLIFTADQPGIAGNHLLSTRRVVVVPAEDGSWSVQLVPSAQTNPETTYTLRIDWLIDTSVPDSRDGLDVLKRIVVPESNANIGDLPATVVARFWAGPQMPTNPQPGLWWLDTSQYPYLMKEWV